MILVPDALLTPYCGGGLWALAAAVLTIAARRFYVTFPTKLQILPLAGACCVTGVQMLALPGMDTLLVFSPCCALALSILLGPYAAFLASVAAIVAQAALWTQCGLYGLGASLVNAAFLPCFLIYPFVFLPLQGLRPSALRTVLAACLSGIVGALISAVLMVLECYMGTAVSLTALWAQAAPLVGSAGLCEGLLTALWALFLRHIHPEHGTSPWSSQSMAIFLAAIGLCGALAGTFSPARMANTAEELIQRAGGIVPLPQAEPHHALRTVHAAWQDLLLSAVQESGDTAVPMPQLGYAEQASLHLGGLCFAVALMSPCIVLYQRQQRRRAPKAEKYQA